MSDAFGRIAASIKKTIPAPSPSRMAQELSSQDRVVVIDEIQRLPILLNEVHRLIEERGIRFLLTGSSARSLRRGGVNLLGGRARTQYLHPLTRRELGRLFDLGRAVERGLSLHLYLGVRSFSRLPLANSDFLYSVRISDCNRPRR